MPIIQMGHSKSSKTVITMCNPISNPKLGKFGEVQDEMNKVIHFKGLKMKRISLRRTFLKEDKPVRTICWQRSFMAKNPTVSSK